MAELTKEQIEVAAPIFYREFSGGVFGPDAKARTVDGLRAAAPFLQMPWDEPSGSELMELWSVFGRILPFDKGVEGAIRRFVELRNAQLLPKPVDPRRKKIMDVLQRRWRGFENHLERYVDEIIAALDEVNP